MELSHREGQEIIVLSDGLAVTFCRSHSGSISSKIKEVTFSERSYNILRYASISGNYSLHTMYVRQGL